MEDREKIIKLEKKMQIPTPSLLLFCFILSRCSREIVSGLIPIHYYRHLPVKRDIEMTATAKVVIPDDEEQNVIKPTLATSVVRRKIGKTTIERELKGKSVDEKTGRRRALPYENPHPSSNAIKPKSIKVVEASSKQTIPSTRDAALNVKTHLSNQGNSAINDNSVISKLNNINNAASSVIKNSNAAKNSKTLDNDVMVDGNNNNAGSNENNNNKNVVVKSNSAANAVLGGTESSGKVINTQMAVDSTAQQHLDNVDADKDDSLSDIDNDEMQFKDDKDAEDEDAEGNFDNEDTSDDSEEENDDDLSPTGTPDEDASTEATSSSKAEKTPASTTAEKEDEDLDGGGGMNEDSIKTHEAAQDTSNLDLDDSDSEADDSDDVSPTDSPAEGEKKNQVITKAITVNADKRGITSYSSDDKIHNSIDTEKGYAELLRLEKDINDIAGDLNKKSKIIKIKPSIRIEKTNIA